MTLGQLRYRFGMYALPGSKFPVAADSIVRVQLINLIGKLARGESVRDGVELFESCETIGGRPSFDLDLLQRISMVKLRICDVTTIDWNSRRMYQK